MPCTLGAARKDIKNEKMVNFMQIFYLIVQTTMLLI